MAAPRGNRFAAAARKRLTPLERFLSFCRFDPETGCVVWIGGRTRGRGKHIPYGVFWFEGKRWLVHRWAAKFIHGLDIDGFDVDHCCERPNTLCVQHVQAITPAKNRELQTRRKFIHLEVGLLRYEDVYGPGFDPDDVLIPYFNPPPWLGACNERSHQYDTGCPF